MMKSKTEKTILDRSHFAEWNEQMAITHDIQDFLENSFFLIRFVENKRIRLLLKFLESNAENRVLEMGCGQGFILKQVKSKFRVGVDLSLSSLKKGLKLFQNEKLKLAVTNTEIMPFSNHQFDRVICTEVIEHVQHPDQLLKELIRLLKANGKAVLTVPNDNLVNWSKKVFEFFKLDKILGVKYGGADEWHIHIFTMKQLKEIFKTIGLCVEKTGYSPCRFFPLRWIFRLSKVTE